jgi:hypothetical protein
MPLDVPFKCSFSTHETSNSAEQTIIIPDTPPPSQSMPLNDVPDKVMTVLDSPPISPKNPKMKTEILDLCSLDIIDLCTPPRLATKAEIKQLMFGPLHPSVKHKQGSHPAKPEPESIDLVSPPHQRSKIEAQEVVVAFGPIKVGNTYDTMDDAVAAVFQAQETLGHKFILGQSHKDNLGVLRRRVLRCNHYRDAVETHCADIDPSDSQKGKSGRTTVRLRWHLFDWKDQAIGGGSLSLMWHTTTITMLRLGDRCSGCQLPHSGKHAGVRMDEPHATGSMIGSQNLEPSKDQQWRGVPLRQSCCRCSYG